MLARIKNKDKVVIVSGKNKGQEGTVIEVCPKSQKVMVKGIAMVKKHAKVRKQGDVAGIKEKEAYLTYAQVMPICSSCKKATRVHTKSLDNGKKARACSRCKEIM